MAGHFVCHLHLSLDVAHREANPKGLMAEDYLMTIRPADGTSPSLKEELWSISVSTTDILQRRERIIV